ncbi:outer membrane lipoprotein carrier protein LolA [Neokomagataea tanensis]|uniref:Outer membrane lipoprotein carrier protein LolA n=2 Tax=Neokomagataea TaxID=1223423 RepID=A0A4Y6V6V1_9PROT|nr:outer membrane lipoprotein carrier protein LolA [Neokomagataea tanensis]
MFSRFIRVLGFSVAAACVVLSVTPVEAQTRAAVLKPVDQGWLERIQDTLGGISTLQARFAQTAPDGGVTHGTASLARVTGQPGKMRFDYDAPSPLLLVANDGRVVFQDRSIDQVTTIPLDRTPLGLLLRPNPKLSGDVTVTTFSHEQGALNVGLVRSDNPGEGTLTLHFSEQPLALQGWTVVDAQGRVTKIALSDVKTGLALAPSLFVLPKSQE